MVADNTVAKQINDPQYSLSRHQYSLSRQTTSQLPQQPAAVATPASGDCQEMGSHANPVDLVKLVTTKIPEADSIEGKVAFEHRVDRTGLFIL